MVRDDFEKWGSNKIELLTVIDDIRNRLKRLGLLRQTEYNGMKNPYHQEESQPAAKKNQGDMRHGSPTLRNIICQTQLICVDTSINFWVYSMNHLKENQRNMDEVNLNQFYRQYMQDPEYRK